jgi:plasmid stability protein
MPITLNLPPELERRLRVVALERGTTTEAYVAELLLGELMPEVDAEERSLRLRQAQIARNQGAIALMDRWLAETEQAQAEGPTGEEFTIAPLEFREVRFD